MIFKSAKKIAKHRLRLRDELALLPKAHERQQIDVGSTLQRAVQYIMGAEVVGDLVEFGTDTGFTASVLARTMAELGATPNRKLWLFDSFEGLPAATAQVDLLNPHVSAGVWSPGRCRGLSAEGLRNQVSRFIDPSCIRIEAGWFAQTVTRVAEDARFALIHVDGDLYQSAIDCLSPLFERKLISKGAAIIFDDWNCGRADNSLGERLAWSEIAGKHHAEFEDFGHHSWAGRSFILHSYR